MTETLQAVRSRFDEIGLRLQDPAVVSDNVQYRSLMKEYRELEPIAGCIDRCEAARDAMQQGREL